MYDCIADCVTCSYCLTVLFTTVFQVMTSYLLCLQNIGLGQYENQNVNRPNHNFCHFVFDFKEFFVGGRLKCQNSMFYCCQVLTQVIANSLNSKYLCNDAIVSG